MRRCTPLFALLEVSEARRGTTPRTDAIVGGRANAIANKRTRIAVSPRHRLCWFGVAALGYFD
jgi:hypothetical protein